MIRVAYITDGEHTLINRLLPSLSGLVGVVDFAAHSRWRYPDPSHTEILCKSLGVPYVRVARSQKPRVASILKAWQTELAISYYAPILPAEVFEAPSLGTINLHPSLLPDYRGANPLFWAVHDLCPQMGSSIHYINRGIDTGAVLAQRAVARPDGASRQQLTQLLVDRLGVDLLLESVQHLAGGRALSSEQCLKSPTPYAARFAPEALLSQVNVEALSLRQWWNIARFFEYWPVPLQQAKAWYAYVRWQVGDYRENSARSTLWGITPEQGRHWLSTPAGQIELIPKFKSKHLLKTGLSQLSRCWPHPTVKPSI